MRRAVSSSRRGAACRRHRPGRPAPRRGRRPLRNRCATHGRVEAAQSLLYLARQHRSGVRVDHQRFGRDPFGIDDLVSVEQKLEIVDEAAAGAGDAVPVEKGPRLDQNLGPAGAHRVMALVDEKTVVGADDKVVFVVQRARGDANRGESAGGAHGLLPDPEDVLRPRVAGENPVADRQRLDRHLRARGQGDVRAARERHAGDLGELAQARSARSIPTSAWPCLGASGPAGANQTSRSIRSGPPRPAPAPRPWRRRAT